MIPILAYHSIAKTSSKKFQRWVIQPSLFQQHMQFLFQEGYHPITVSQLVSAIPNQTSLLPAKPILLTFDDAFEDFYTNAMPIMRSYNFTATLYIPTKYVGLSSLWLQAEGEASRPLMSWEQIKEVNKIGIECGSHSHSHAQLDILKKDLARDEIFLSKKILEDQLGKEISSFAYPFGYHDKTTRQLVIEAGYSSACAVKYALSNLKDDHFALSRIIVENISTSILKDILDNKGLLWPPYERLRSLAWRLVRRIQSNVISRTRSQ